MLKINEIFGPTVQGEGKSVGKGVMFIRTAQCNLHCHWCDTPYTWNWIGTKFSHPEKYDPEKEIHEMSKKDIVHKLESLGGKSVKAVVVSGGEPMLQQKQLLPLFKLLTGMGWWIEIETNGTVPPKPEFLGMVDQINCSPKLSNSGDSKKLRVRPKALEKLAACAKVNFKFVVGNQDDINEVFEYIDTFNLKDVYLMPMGKTKEELALTTDMTKELCGETGLKYSGRIHITQYGGGRGI